MTKQTKPPTTGTMDKWLAWAETKISLSLAVSLFFKPPSSSFAEGLLECYREYLELCGPHLTWYGSETSSRYREASPKVLQIPFRRLPEAIEQGKYWAWMAYSGADYRDAAPYQFEAYVPNEPTDLSSFRAAFPVEMFGSDPSVFLALVKKLAGRAPFSFGYAGFSFSESLEIKRRQANEVYLIPAAMRFSGVEVEGEYQIPTRLSCLESIKGVNWLTLLSPQFVEKLGGNAALRAQLGGGIELHVLPTGLMIQAGPAPELGDVNAGARLPLYREVHKAVQPVRAAELWAFGGGGFNRALTNMWLRRFDD